MSEPNLGRLVAQGRVKAHGVSWNDEETQAIYTHKIPVLYVRMGILTPEAYQEKLAEEATMTELPLYKLSRVQLYDRAKALGFNVTPAADEGRLIGLIESKMQVDEKPAEDKPRAKGKK